MRSFVPTGRTPSRRSGPAKPSPNNKVCIVCRQASRPFNHFLSTCAYLPESDRKFLSRVRHVAIQEGDEEYYEDSFYYT